MLTSRVALVGEEPSRYRVIVALIVLLAIVTVGFLAEVGGIVPLSGLELGVVVFLISAGIAGYAGWSHGGALTANIVVLLTLLWMAFVPPIVGYLQGEEWAGTRYSTFRISDAMLTPMAELETAIRLLPFYAAIALPSATCAFLLASRARTFYEK
jgi:hypothetical protein